MEWYIKIFIRSSLVWLTLGVLAGLAIVVHPPWLLYRPAHAHLNVVGFLTMFVFGVGYQLLPRLFGHPLHSQRLAVVHVFVANIGLGLLVLGFLVAPQRWFDSRWLSATGGSLFALGALFWVYNLWRTFDAGDAREQARIRAGRTQLPTTGQ